MENVLHRILREEEKNSLFPLKYRKKARIWTTKEMLVRSVGSGGNENVISWMWGRSHDFSWLLLLFVGWCWSGERKGHSEFIKCAQGTFCISADRRAKSDQIHDGENPTHWKKKGFEYFLDTFFLRCGRCRFRKLRKLLLKNRYPPHPPNPPFLRLRSRSLNLLSFLKCDPARPPL